MSIVSRTSAKTATSRKKSFRRANELIAPKAAKLLKAGTPVIFDGNFYWQSQITDLLARLSYPHQIFTLTAPLAVCIQRDKDRPKPHGKDAASAVYAKSTSFACGISVDVTCPIDECIAVIKKNLPS